jgi:hypothetical protein
LVVRSVVVGLVAEHLEVRVETDLDHSPVVQTHLDPVRGAVVARLGLRHGSAAGELQRRRAGPVQRRAREGPVRVPRSGGDGDARTSSDERQRERASGDPLRPAIHAIDLLGSTARARMTEPAMRGA